MPYATGADTGRGILGLSRANEIIPSLFQEFCYELTVAAIVRTVLVQASIVRISCFASGITPDAK